MAVVEVRWLGFWFDLDPPDPASGKYKETRLAEQLLATGCEVIAHNLDNGRAVEAVETARVAGRMVWSIGNDHADACSAGPTSCLGTTAWNWGPLYAQLFDQMYRGTWTPSIVNVPMLLDPKQSVPNFAVNDAVAGTDLNLAVGEQLAALAATDAWKRVFRGPYCSTGQRMPACVADGQTLSDDEYRAMCWAMDGVVEKTDPNDPTSADRPAQIPADCLTNQ
jgi:hypothetical protein